MQTAALSALTGSATSRLASLRTDFAPKIQVSVTGDGTNFEVTGCGKSARYSCCKPSDASNKAGFVCSDSARTPWRNEHEQRPQSLIHPEPVSPGPEGRP
jgi:hypothetical protein